jgi:hypothetical protein
MTGHVNCLQKKIIAPCPNALFAHCYAHSINLVLQQNLAIIAGQISQSGALAPLRGYYVWWSQETSSVGLTTGIKEG